MDRAFALDVSDVSKRYGPTVALEHASFTVGKGEIHALIGENGAGKSTLVKILSGIHQPDAGSISVAGQNAVLRSSRDASAIGLATAFQELSLVPLLTVSQNMMLGREPRSRFGLVSNDSVTEATRRCLDEWELDGIDLDAPVSDLSLALRQQIELVRALSKDASVLLLDEPTAALGTAQVEWLFRQIARFRNEGGTVLFISHRMGEVREICDNATVLRNGHDVATFPTNSATDDEVIEMMLGHSIEQTMLTRSVESEVGDPLLVVRHLSSPPALRDVSFELHAGEVLGVAALQGHGQLELFKSLFGAHPSTGGTIEINDRITRMRSPRHAISEGVGISLVPEDRKTEGIMLEMSGLANVTLPSIGRYSRFGFLNKRAERVAATKVFDALDIRLSALDGDVSDLSGGNQQKVAIGKWVLADNHVLLMYDPTRGVDIGTKTEIFEMMRDIASGGRSILFYSTEIDELLSVSNRILVMYRGNIASELSGTECTKNNILSAMLGPSSDASTNGATRPDDIPPRHEL